MKFIEVILIKAFVVHRPREFFAHWNGGLNWILKSIFEAVFRHDATRLDRYLETIDLLLQNLTLLTPRETKFDLENEFLETESGVIDMSSLDYEKKMNEVDAFGKLFPDPSIFRPYIADFSDDLQRHLASIVADDSLQSRRVLAKLLKHFALTLQL